ncbi:16S rRNA (cytidine(1402)-2'-O)-methyltransferase [Candidatus Pelagibacter sp.]|nr:16S rRNA (cytidine(1402)-2'-O)-methyltransferase [Candidatus Pelagibacter sp.]MDC0915801.1 16S rRNA (cytidine(1402)-2'-O)-methyltransferase [Candidatus Pelagibacter sp.]MDC0924957.1 16S rRNA (cytidine(1402)-2'-O)-methyltransferase [Candidatus Pelagibacter sp.]
MIIKSQSQIKDKDNENGLYLVSTPIGNLKDVTLRAIETLKKSTYILCEDTRVSRILLDRYEIKSSLISNHKFNESKNLNKVLELLKSGETISLISDAGTPSISDPGAILVNECIKNNIKIIPIPGPSAVAAAISISGFSEKFIFYGFLPEKKQAIANVFNQISKFNDTCVFFVSSKKVNKIIPELKKNFSGRKIVFCREISKLYEEFIRKNVDDLEIFNKELKGELTIVISEKKIEKNHSQELSESDMNNINKMINKLSIKEITEIISQNKDISKKKIYDYCLKIKNEI